MENFKQIERCDVWPHLQSGKKVFAVIFQSRRFNAGLYKLRNWDVEQINHLLEKDKDDVFYEEIEKSR